VRVRTAVTIDERMSLQEGNTFAVSIVRTRAGDGAGDVPDGGDERVRRGGAVDGVDDGAERREDRL
jgi:hypothetical protein